MFMSIHQPDPFRLLVAPSFGQERVPREHVKYPKGSKQPFRVPTRLQPTAAQHSGQLPAAVVALARH